MSPGMHGSTTSWSVLTAVVLAGFAFVYVRGWYRLSHIRRSEANGWRASAFLSGELLFFAAIASPLARLDHQWLTAHMVQHLALMTLAAPLILLGEPALMFLNGLPQRFGTTGPDSRRPCVPIHAAGRLLANPIVCWLAGTVCVIVWHIPGPFDLSMQAGFWHAFEQASFFAAGLLFWLPVVQPWPSIPKWHRWSVPLYLFLATIPCDVLSAFLVFCGRVVFPIYASSSPLFNNFALNDQELAGAMMWVWVTFAYLAPAVVITMQMLSPMETPRQTLVRARWLAPAARLLNGGGTEEL